MQLDVSFLINIAPYSIGSVCVSLSLSNIFKLPFCLFPVFSSLSLPPSMLFHENRKRAGEGESCKRETQREREADLFSRLLGSSTHLLALTSFVLAKNKRRERCRQAKTRKKAKENFTYAHPSNTEIIYPSFTKVPFVDILIDEISRVKQITGEIETSNLR